MTRRRSSGTVEALNPKRHTKASGALAPVGDEPIDSGHEPLPHKPPGLPPEWPADIESYLADFNIGRVSDFEDVVLIWSELWTPILNNTIGGIRWNPSRHLWI